MTLANTIKPAAVAAAIVASLSWAGISESRAEPSVFRVIAKKCTTINCSADLIRGSISGFGANTNPWTGVFLLQAGKCARFDVIKATADLEATLVAPNGTIFSDDDSGAGLNPLLGIGSVTINGAYTMVINNFAGTSIDDGFLMAVAQYPTSNPNCVSTPPRAVQDDRAKAATGGLATEGGPRG